MKHIKLKKAVMFIAFLVTFIPLVAHAEGTIQLPQTGQTKCYDSAGTEIACAGTGQDGELQKGAVWPSPRFTPGAGAEAECMIDNLTGLMWPKNGNLPNGTKTWNDAIDYPKTLTLCGHSDWRLPNINELESLVNASQSNLDAWFNTQGFTNVQSDNCWSSTTYARNTGSAWLVGMYGNVLYGSKNDPFYVWPVRAGQSGSLGNAISWKTGQTTSYRSGDDGDLKQGASWPSPRFTDHNTGEVTDNLTGLVWTKDANAPGPSACGPAAQKTWQGELDYVKCLNTQNYLGHTDWRLPNRKELRSLADYSRYETTLPSGHPFTNVQSDNYRSSTTYANRTAGTWLVDMMGSSVAFSYKTTSNYYVWPVRAGQADSSPMNGACGSANGGTFTSAPASNLCSAGTASSVSGSGPWTWSCTGSDGGTNANCSASLQQPTQFTLTVTKSGAGSGSVAANTGTISWTNNTGTASYNSGTSVTLTATAASGSTFTGWSGSGCSGTGTCVVTMNAAKNATAEFGVASTPVNGACGSSNGGTFASAPASNLCSAGTASSVSGSGPWTWSCTGSGGGTTASCSANLQQQPSQFTLTMTKSGTGSGTVTANSGTIGWNRNTGTVSYNSGTSVTLTATTDTGSTFTGWLGSGCSGTGTCAVTMDAARNVTATFRLNSPGPSGVIKLPKTGQNTKYFAGDDGDLQSGAAWPSPRFHDNTDGTVTDNLTGLVWTKDANAPGPAACSPGSGKTWVEAIAYAACLNTNNYLGHNDWRLPNVNELSSLTDYANYNTVLPTGHPFSNAASDWYWSSSAYIACSNYALNVLMQYGDISFQNKAVSRFVWPVHGQCESGSSACVPKTGQTASCVAGDDGALQAGVAWPANRFADNNDGTVTDGLTGLMWLKDANCMKTSYPSFDNSLTSGDGDVTRQMALNFVAGINSGQYSNCRAGHSDWRLPNINELNSLMDRSKNNPDLPAGNPFLNALGGYVSSTARAVTTSNAWGVSFENGGVGAGDGAVWPVRSDPVTFKLTVAASGIGAGAVTSDPAGLNCGLDCSENYSSGTAITLTATASSVSTFAGWSGSGCSGMSTCSFTLNADTVVTATFTKMPVGIGDVNYDGQVNLTDAVLALQVNTGISPQQIVYKEADVNGDGKIGPQEAVYIMQKLAGLRLTLMAPNAPTDVSAVASDGQVTLSWQEVTGATSYNVYYRTTAGVTTTNGTKVTGVTGSMPGRVILGLTNGTTYYFIVTARNGGLESVLSDEVMGTPNVVPAASVKWYYQLSVGTDWQSAVYVSPALGADGTIYIGNNLDAKVVAMNPDGTKKWEFLAAPDLAGATNLTRPLAVGADGTIYISSGNTKMFAINPDGSQKWVQTFADSVWGMSSGIAISYDGATLYGLGQAGKLYAVRSSDGGKLWEFATGDGGGNMHSTPVVGQDGTIYFGGGGYNSPNKKLYAINPNGTQKWAFLTGGLILASPSIGTDGTVYIGSQDGYLFAVKPDGTQKWRSSVGTVSGSTAAIDRDGNSYFGSYAGGMYSFDSAGNLRWTFTTNGGIDITPLIGNDGNIYVLTTTGYAYCVNKAGVKQWELNITGGMASSPVMDSSGVLYFGNYDGKIYAVQTTATGIDVTAQWPMFGGDVKHSGRQK